MLHINFFQLTNNNDNNYEYNIISLQILAIFEIISSIDNCQRKCYENSFIQSSTSNMGDQVCFSYHNISFRLVIKVEALQELGIRIRIMPRHKVREIYSCTRWKTFESQGHVSLRFLCFGSLKGLDGNLWDEITFKS